MPWIQFGCLIYLYYTDQIINQIEFVLPILSRWKMSLIFKKNVLEYYRHNISTHKQNACKKHAYKILKFLNFFTVKFKNVG